MVREDQREDDVFALIGPKKVDVPWKVLEGEGWIATAACTEVRLPLPEPLRMPYAVADARQKFRLASENPLKTAAVRELLARHPGEPTLIIGMYVEQIKQILVTAAAKPIRLRVNDGALFAKAQQELEASFLPLPQWFQAVAGPSAPSRTDVAVTWLRAMELIRTTTTDGLWLEPTERGRQWLGGNAKQRLKAVLDHLKQPLAKESRALGARDDDDLDLDEDDFDLPTAAYDEFAEVGFAPSTIRFPTNSNEVSLRSLVGEAYSSLVDKEFVSLSDFVHWHIQQQNPLVKLWRPEKRPSFYVGWSWRKTTAEDLEDLWGNVLLDFFCLRLVPLGGVRVGLAGKRGLVCLALTDIGRYLLDETEFVRKLQSLGLFVDRLPRAGKRSNVTGQPARRRKR